MSIATELERIQTDRNTIRTKLVALGLASEVDNLDKLATAVNGIVNQGAIEAEVTEGTSYTIPKGYHNGSGVVKSVSDAEGDAVKYKTQAKTVTPTKEQQNISPDAGYYALSAVTVNAIPTAYQDVTSVTATAADVLATKVFVDKSGKVTTGTMANNGAVSKTLDTSTTSYTVPAGYHSGSGKVSISTETKSATPSTSEQTITPTAGKVLSSVAVGAIPITYGNTSDATATSADILKGKTAYIYDSTNAKAVKATGTMANNGALAGTIDGLSTTSYTIMAGYYSGGSVSLTSAIETALSEI